MSLDSMNDWRISPQFSFCYAFFSCLTIISNDLMTDLKLSGV
jgi:hypothetical protein